MKTDKKPRVLLAKTSLDGHDRGIKVLSKFLRDVGMEIIYLGTLQTPEKILQTAIQEDVDVIGLSFLSGEHLSHTKKISKLIKKYNLVDRLFLVGGVIPVQDIPKLKKIGVDEVFTAGSLLGEIEEYIRNNLRRVNS